MKVFSKEKYLAQPSLEYLKEASLHSGWVDECDGKHVIDGRCGRFMIRDNWCKREGCEKWKGKETQ